MRQIAYKTADHIKSITKNSLPKNWITEYTYVDYHQNNSLKSEDGWQFLPEDEFNELFTSSNSDEILNAYLENRLEEECKNKRDLFTKLEENFKKV